MIETDSAPKIFRRQSPSSVQKYSPHAAETGARNPKRQLENVATGVAPAVEAGILPSGKNRALGGNAHFYQVDGEVALFPPGGTHQLYVSQDGRRYHF
jgi:hypothetical protein